MESVIGRPFRSGWVSNPILPEDHRWPPVPRSRPSATAQSKARERSAPL